LAQRLKEDLVKRGHEVWFDKDQLKEGGDWEQYIDDGLNWVSKDPETGRVVFIMTPILSEGRTVTALMRLRRR